VWSLSPDLGYYSKPPLLAWLINFITQIFGDSFETLKMTSVSMYILTSVAVYLLYKKLYKNKGEAVLAGLTFYLIPVVTVSSFLISTDILLVLFWTLSLFFVLKIRDEPTIVNFLLLGIFVGLSFLTKYAAIYFIFFNYFNFFY
jgi:4-amino-4-deoxy-L-arabinose transferase-like glycosyltransferase